MAAATIISREKRLAVFGHYRVVIAHLEVSTGETFSTGLRTILYWAATPEVAASAPGGTVGTGADSGVITLVHGGAADSHMTLIAVGY